MLLLVASLLAVPTLFTQQDGFTKVDANANPNFAKLLKGKGFVLGNIKDVRKNILPKPVVEGDDELISEEEFAGMKSAQKAKLIGNTAGAFILGEPVKPIQKDSEPQIVEKSWTQIRAENGLYNE